MKKFYDVILDEAGNIVVGAEVYVRDNASPNSLVTLYSESTGTTTTANPTISGSDGYIEFWTADNMLKLEVYIDGELEKTVTDYQHFDATDTFVIACSDETTALSAATDVVKFRIPFACTLLDVRGSLSTTQASGNIFTVDVNESGTTVLSTKLTIDNGEKTSTTAATPVVIGDTSLAEDAEITIDIDQIGNGTAKGLKVTLVVRRL